MGRFTAEPAPEHAESQDSREQEPYENGHERGNRKRDPELAHGDSE